MSRFSRPRPKAVNIHLVSEMLTAGAMERESAQDPDASPVTQLPDTTSTTAGPSAALALKRRPSLSDAVHTVRSFISAVRHPKPTVTCLVFSWYGYASLRMFEARPRACLNKVVLTAWIGVFMQITMSLLLFGYYLSLKVQLPLVLLADTWRGDCSGVDRCWRLSVSLINAGKPTNYVCTASLSQDLPLWSNNRQCAECPPLLNINNFSKVDACDRFGRLDDLAGAYLDFWSGETILPKHGLWGEFDEVSTQPAKPTLFDANGPFSRTCSESRRTNGHGQARHSGSYYCIDCFGDDCAKRSFEDSAAANAVKKSHCEERFACPAFDFDHGQCDKNFFSTVCNTKKHGGHATGSSSYPRRFSDLPGFGFFRNWPHSFVDSCRTPSLNTTALLLTASGRAITQSERFRLRALCQLHRRCVREHPDVACEPTAFESRDLRMREAAGQQDAQSWWNLPVGVASHDLQSGGVWQLVSAIFIFYIVSCDIARTYHVCQQNLLFLDMASQQRRRTTAKVLPFHGSNHRGGEGEEAGTVWGSCRRVMLGFAARFLQYSLRDGLLPIALWPTYSAVIAVTTPLDVVFCGTIMLIILQLDNLQMSTLITDVHQLEMATKYSVVLTKQQADMLEYELNLVFWSAWAWLIIIYVVMVQVYSDILLHPDRDLDSWKVNASYIMMVGFMFTNAVISVVCRAWHRDTSVPFTRFVRQIAVDSSIRIAIFFFWNAYQIVIEFLLYLNASELQAAYGDTNYVIPQWFRNKH